MSAEATENVPLTQQLSPRRRLVAVVCIASALGAISLNQIGPFYTSEALAKNPTGGPEYNTAVGAVYSTFMFSGIAISPLIIWDLPNIGSKNLLVLSLTAEGGSHFLFAFVDRIDNWRIFLAYSYCFRIIQGVSFFCLNLGSMSYLVKLYPTSLGFVNGFLLTFLSSGDVVGVLLSGGLYDLSGFEAPFLVAGAIMVVVAITMAILMDDIDTLTTTSTGPITDANVKEKDVSVATILRVPWVWWMILTLLMSNVAFGANSALLAADMKKELGSSATVFSVAFSFQVVLNMVSAPVTGMLLDRGWNSRLLIVIGAVLVGISCFLVGPSGFLHLPKSLWLVFVAMVPIGIGHILMATSSIFYMYEHCKCVGLGTAVELRVAVSGVSRVILSTGYGAGPVSLSPLVSVLGFSEAFTILGFAYFGTALLIVALYFLSKASTAMKNQCSNGSHSEGAGDMEMKPLRP